MSGEIKAGAAPGRIDFHSHSKASDGTLTPSELAGAALKTGLSMLALTDHDSVDGVPEFLEAGRALNFSCLGGVEISLEHPGTMHMLGLDVAGDGRIPAAMNHLKKFREQRNVNMLEKLKGLGYELSWDRLKEIAGDGQLGRPHFATALLEAGYCQTRDEAFDRLLGKNKPAYVNKKRFSPREGLEIIRDAGWAPVLAHPQSLNIADDEYEPLLKKLKDWGLLGLEVYHPSQSAARSAFFGRIAQRLDLTPSAGSDFHGDNKPEVCLAWVQANSPLGTETFDCLRAKMLG